MRKAVLVIAGLVQLAGTGSACYQIFKLTEGLPPGGAQDAAVYGLGGVVALLIGQGVANAAR